jgi:predicted PurR-regulated permease PerM
VVDHLAAYSWRLVAIGTVVVASVWLLGRLRAVVAALVVALLLARALAPVSSWLRRHRWRPSLAALTTLLVFFALLAGVFAVIVPSLADEAGSLGPTLTQALDDVEDWLVEDGPFNVSRETIDELRAQGSDRLRALFRQSDGAVLDGATLAAEVITALVVAVILTFFMLRDGGRFATWAYRRARPGRRQAFQRAAERGWATLGGYLRGVVILGTVEAVVIGAALFLAGGSLVPAVMVLTFLGAFVPLAGAATAGVIAVLIGLVTGGLVTAIVVAVVALVVQQVDNDLLAPVIYGKALDLHPAVVLLSIVTGGALFGISGTLLAVPVVAVSVAVSKELRANGENDPTGPAPTAGGGPVTPVARRADG